LVAESRTTHKKLDQTDTRCKSYQLGLHPYASARI
jgi:hypothetical protein